MGDMYVGGRMRVQALVVPYGIEAHIFICDAALTVFKHRQNTGLGNIHSGRSLQTHDKKTKPPTNSHQALYRIFIGIPCYNVAITQGVLMAHYILFDTETTGNQAPDRIIQVGAMIVRSREEVEVIDELCRTDVPISIEAMEVHGITPDKLESKPRYAETHFAARIDALNTPDNYLIAHNIDFDLGMIEKEGFRNQMQKIDTVRCARHLLPALPYHRLQYLRYALELYKDEEAEARKLGVTVKAHDAIGDVLILKLLFTHLIGLVREQFPDGNPIEKMVALTQEPVMIRTFKFGKYKGESIEEISQRDPGYLSWMRKNLDLDEDMRHTLDAYLQ